MAGDITPFIIRIQTALEKGGIEGAKTELAALTAETDKAKKSGNDAKEGSINASQGFAALGQAAASANGNVGSMASALGGLAQQLPQLAKIAGPIGLAVAAFLAWQQAIEKLKDSSKEFDKSLRDTAIGNAEASIHSLVTSYKDLKDSIAAASDESQRYYDAESSKDDARTRADMAAVELEKAQRTEGLDPNDKFAARRLDVEMAEKRAGIEDAAAKRKADRDLLAMRAQANALEASKVAAAEQFEQLGQQFPELSRQFESVRGAAQEDANKWYRTPGQKRAIFAEAQPELDRIVKAMESVAAEMKATKETNQQSENSLTMLGERADVAMINRATLGVSSKSGAITRKITSSAIQREQRQAAEETIRGAQEKQQQLEEQGNKLRTKAFSEYDDVRKARRTGQGDMAKELKEWQDAAIELRKFVNDTGSVMQKLKGDIQQANNTLSDMKAQQARPGSGG